MNDAWIITDGAAGNVRQARALAQAARLTPAEIVVKLRAPWAWSAPHMPRAGQLAIDSDTRRRLQPPWPTVAIGCGRTAAWVTRWLRKRSRVACYCVQILDPRSNPCHWDLVIAPRHDGVRGDNVLTPLGSLNPVDAGWLASARADFAGLGDLPQPRTAVLLGGPRRGIAFEAAQARALTDGLTALHARDGGSFMLSTSARTPAGFAQLVQAGLQGFPGIAFTMRSDELNPYPGLLAWADRVVVTPDSVNMLSEAAASGAPAHTLVSGELPPRIARFHAALREGGWLHDLDAIAAAPARPLRETGEIAAELLRRLAARRQ